MGHPVHVFRHATCEAVRFRTLSDPRHPTPSHCRPPDTQQTPNVGRPTPCGIAHCRIPDTGQRSALCGIAHYVRRATWAEAAIARGGWGERRAPCAEGRLGKGSSAIVRNRTLHSNGDERPSLRRRGWRSPFATHHSPKRFHLFSFYFSFFVNPQSPLAAASLAVRHPPIAAPQASHVARCSPIAERPRD
jgi:hypothetical protein